MVKNCVVLGLGFGLGLGLGLGVGIILLFISNYKLFFAKLFSSYPYFLDQHVKKCQLKDCLNPPLK